ncbi:hypothetical protein GCM10023153_15270 [Ornithinibacter aureus]|uniref:Uncharacterized protein n=1 Tax=Ornithinibacter aureus TaxID=622664 RepID=A0ABP8JQN4_9MICO|nr:hypothetical protein [Ornithinibacter aureus]KAF0834961.1 hypothetical protein C8E84_2818 [Ornithinibacter aureus]
MSNDLPLNEQLDLVRRTVAQTLAGKIEWKETGEAGTYRSVRPNAVAVLDRIGTGMHARVRLRFSPPGQSAFDTIITQVLTEGEPFREEQDLDGQLELLYARVDARSDRHRTSASLFLDDDD